MVDITSDLFQLPEVAGDALYAKVMPPQLSDLTEGKVGGVGSFDQLMVSLKAHLKDEYANNRITGSEYTKAYISLAQAAMQFAVQWELGKQQVFWQAQTAQISALTGRIGLEKARFEYSQTLPAQLKLIQEQMEVQHAQTCDTRTDGATVVGLIGKQKALYGQQITSYQRDAEYKAAKIFSDAWVTQKTIDEGLDAPTAFTNSVIDSIMSVIKTNNGLA